MPVQRLHTERDRFIREDGIPWNWAGHITFMLYKRSLDGVIIEPHLERCYSYGSRCAVTLMMAHYIEHFDPRLYGDTYFSHMRSFAQALDKVGYYWCPIIFADAQVIMPDRNEQLSFYARVCESLAGEPNVLPSLGNEWQKNGFFPGEFPYSNNGLLWSRGSAIADTEPYRPGWDWKEWHSRRDWPKVLVGEFDGWYVKEGINESGHRLDKPMPAISAEPMGFWENNIPGRRSNDPNLAMVLGGNSIYHLRGGNFHSENGLRSEDWDETTTECARRFFKAINQND